MADPLALELEAIRRGISTAELLRQQSVAPRRIDSPTQGLAQLAQAFVAGRAGQKADARLTAFQDKNETASESDTASILAALQSDDPNALATALIGSSNSARQDAGITLASSQNKATATARVKAEAEAKALKLKTESANTKADLLISQGRLKNENRDNFVSATIAGETGLIKSSSSGFEAFGKAFADSLSKGDRSKVNRAYLDLGKATKKSLSSFDKILDSIDKDPQSVTLGGTASEAIASIEANLKGLGKTLGFDVNLVDFAIDSAGNEAVKSASVRANIKKVVRDFARAKGEFGKSLSDKDLVDFTQQITARWGNPEAIKSVLLERRNELVDEFNLETDVNRQAGFSIPDIKQFSFNKRDSAISADNSINDKRKRLEELRSKKAGG